MSNVGGDYEMTSLGAHWRQLVDQELDLCVFRDLWTLEPVQTLVCTQAPSGLPTPISPSFKALRAACGVMKGALALWQLQPERGLA